MGPEAAVASTQPWRLLLPAESPRATLALGNSTDQEPAGGPKRRRPAASSGLIEGPRKLGSPAKLNQNAVRLLNLDLVL